MYWLSYKNLTAKKSTSGLIEVSQGEKSTSNYSIRKESEGEESQNWVTKLTESEYQSEKVTRALLVKHAGAEIWLWV